MHLGDFSAQVPVRYQMQKTKTNSLSAETVAMARAQ